MLEDALAYHLRYVPQALVVAGPQGTVLERYENGCSADRPHALYSGTKSFWGVTAVTAALEGILDIDERVADTITSWRIGPKAEVTLRQLLQLCAGVPFGGLGSAVPLYEKALATQLRYPPGTRFTYGGIPLQIFGAVFTRKLAALDMSPHDYLYTRLLEPNGIHVASWRTLTDGSKPLPTGASLTARDWLRYGWFVAAQRHVYAQCFIGSVANPRYGLGWWLAPKNAPHDLVYATGAGGQGLYVILSRSMVVIRFAKSGSFNHDEFLKRLLS